MQNEHLTSIMGNFVQAHKKLKESGVTEIPFPTKWFRETIRLIKESSGSLFQAEIEEIAYNHPKWLNENFYKVRDALISIVKKMEKKQ